MIYPNGGFACSVRDIIIGPRPKRVRGRGTAVSRFCPSSGRLGDDDYSDDDLDLRTFRLEQKNAGKKKISVRRRRCHDHCTGPAKRREIISEVRVKNHGREINRFCGGNGMKKKKTI